MQRLDLMHAATRVPVVLSKISIASRVPVTVALAVATSSVVWPAGTEAWLAARLTRWKAKSLTPSDSAGTLGCTGVEPTRVGSSPGEAFGGSSRVSSHAAGAATPDFSASVAQAPRPAGSVATPGPIEIGTVPQLAPAPEAGHCLAPG